jgi:hypothetical protein
VWKAYHDEHYDSKGSRIWVGGGEGVRDTEGTYVDPPANAKAAYEICQEDGYQAVLMPAVSDADVAKIVTDKGELVPEAAQWDCTKEEEAAPV